MTCRNLLLDSRRSPDTVARRACQQKSRGCPGAVCASLGLTRPPDPAAGLPGRQTADFRPNQDVDTPSFNLPHIPGDHGPLAGCALRRPPDYRRVPGPLIRKSLRKRCRRCSRRRRVEGLRGKGGEPTGTKHPPPVFLIEASAKGEAQTRADSAASDCGRMLRRPSPLMSRRRAAALVGGIIGGVEKGSFNSFYWGSAIPEMGSK
jgi:hypothetical protein